jgi:CheY-like chemotaxis protein
VWDGGSLGRPNCTRRHDVRNPLRHMRSVLVIDDDDDLLEAVGEGLTTEGFTVRVAHDGADAFAKLARGALPDVILLDLNMPHMSGWKFRELQQRHAALRHIPVVVMSASMPIGIDASAVVEKPCAPALLAATLRSVIPAQPAARQTETGSWLIVRPTAEDHDLRLLIPEAKTA